MSIKLDEFFNEYNIKDDGEKVDFVRSHIKYDYVDYEKKVAIAQSIVQNSYWKSYKDIDGNDKTEFYIDSTVKHMLICMAIISLYTDIDRSNESSILKDFNELNKVGILDMVLENSNQRELKEFKMVVDMVCSDLIANEYENHAFFAKQIDKIVDMGKIVLRPIIEQVDIEKLNNVISQI